MSLLVASSPSGVPIWIFDSPEQFDAVSDLSHDPIAWRVATVMGPTAGFVVAAFLQAALDGESFLVRPPGGAGECWDGLAAAGKAEEWGPLAAGLVGWTQLVVCFDGPNAAESFFMAHARSGAPMELVEDAFVRLRRNRLLPDGYTLRLMAEGVTVEEVDRAREWADGYAPRREPVDMGRLRDAIEAAHEAHEESLAAEGARMHDRNEDGPTERQVAAEAPPGAAAHDANADGRR